LVRFNAVLPPPLQHAIASHAFVNNTNIVAGAAMLAWMPAADQIKGKKFKVTGMCLGIVVGLSASPLDLLILGCRDGTPPPSPFPWHSRY
jgi:hypothetical protein